VEEESDWGKAFWVFAFGVHSALTLSLYPHKQLPVPFVFVFYVLVAFHFFLFFFHYYSHFLLPFDFVLGVYKSCLFNLLFNCDRKLDRVVSLTFDMKFWTRTKILL